MCLLSNSIDCASRSVLFFEQIRKSRNENNLLTGDRKTITTRLNTIHKINTTIRVSKPSTMRIPTLAVAIPLVIAELTSLRARARTITTKMVTKIIPSRHTQPRRMIPAMVQLLDSNRTSTTKKVVNRGVGIECRVSISKTDLR